MIKLGRSVLHQAFLGTAQGQLSVIGYDSDLSGIFAPFSKLSAGESRQLEILSSEKAFEERLNYIAQQIQAVQNVIQGRCDSLYEFRRMVGKPIEGYHLIVLSIDMGLISIELRSKLSLLMRSGPAYGFSFLIISTTEMSFQTASGKDIDISVKAIAPNITVLEAVEPNIIEIIGSGNKTQYEPVTPEIIISDCQKIITNVKSTRLPTITFDSIHDLSNYWKETSTDGLAFTIGIYGIESMDIIIGDEANQRHNVLITGAVGQGKSNLLSVIIHSLCLRYSPDELMLYLLDFKEGVTFKPFSNIDQEEYLPHAEAIGLESDVSFGVAVLESLHKEYKRRMQRLKDCNARSLKEYRNINPQEQMPRIVVVIDEFQMMFGDDLQTGQKIAEMLEKSVRLFRAAGIHFILASQTLSGNMALSQKRESLFSQVPIRIALKNSISESHQTLALNNPAAAYLRPREAIVNLDYGEVSQNRKTIIAFADENLLKPVRKAWWERTRAKIHPPYVFESEKYITVKNGINAIRELRMADSVPSAVIGDRISIDGEHIVIPLMNEPGYNIAILGMPDNDCNHATGIIQSIAVSIAFQHPKGDARFMFVDFDAHGMTHDTQYHLFVKLMEDAGYYVEIIEPMSFESEIDALINEIPHIETIYVFGLGMDRWK